MSSWISRRRIIGPAPPPGRWNDRARTAFRPAARLRSAAGFLVRRSDARLRRGRRLAVAQGHRHGELAVVVPFAERSAVAVRKPAGARAVRNFGDELLVHTNVSAASEVSPVISKSASLRSSKRTPDRTTGWSSASRTVAVVVRMSTVSYTETAPFVATQKKLAPPVHGSCAQVRHRHPAFEA